MQLVRHQPLTQKLTPIEADDSEIILYPSRFASLAPVEEPKQQPTQDPIALKLFLIASVCLGAIGLVIVGLLMGRSSAPTVQPSPTIVVVPAPAPISTQQPSKSSCLILCSQ